MSTPASFNFLNLSPTLSAADLPKVFARATATPGVTAVTLPPVLARFASHLVVQSQSPLTLCVPISFPHGPSKATVKAIESTSALKDGAAELIVAPHFPLLLADDLSAARDELREIARAARATRRDAHLRLALTSAALFSRPDRHALFPAIARCALESAFDSLYLFPHDPDVIPSLTPLLPVEAEVFSPDNPKIPPLLAAGVNRFAVQSLGGPSEMPTN